MHFDLSLEMAIHTSNSFEMPLLLSTFSNVLPQVICGQPIGRVAKKHQQIALSYVLNNSPEQVAGHVARMPMTRAPGQLLTCWVPHSRPIGCTQMTWGRTLENALKSKGISKNFDEWIAIAKDRSKWRQLTHSIPKPPDA